MDSLRSANGAMSIDNVVIDTSGSCIGWIYPEYGGFAIRVSDQSGTALNNIAFPKVNWSDRSSMATGTLFSLMEGVNYNFSDGIWQERPGSWVPPQNLYANAITRTMDTKFLIDRTSIFSYVFGPYDGNHNVTKKILTPTNYHNWLNDNNKNGQEVIIYIAHVPCITTKMLFDNQNYNSQVPGGPDTWNFVEIKLNNTFNFFNPGGPTGFLPRCGSFALNTPVEMLPNYTNPNSTIKFIGRPIADQHTQPGNSQGTFYSSPDSVSPACTPVRPITDAIQVLPGDGLGIYISHNSLCYEVPLSISSVGQRQQKFISISPATFSLKVTPS
jgi:hypothetical protein